MDYYDLLELDTENADIQFQLYKACLEMGNEAEAKQWLDMAAGQGYQPALDIAGKKEESVSNITPYYSDKKLFELVDISDSDYYATKEVIRRIKGKADFDELGNWYEKLIRFKESVAEDFVNYAVDYSNDFLYRYHDVDDWAFVSKLLDSVEELDRKLGAKTRFELLCDRYNINKLWDEEATQKIIPEIYSAAHKYFDSAEDMELIRIYNIICNDLFDNMPNVAITRLGMKEGALKVCNKNGIPLQSNGAQDLWTDPGKISEIRFDKATRIIQEERYDDAIALFNLSHEADSQKMVDKCESLKIGNQRKQPKTKLLFLTTKEGDYVLNNTMPQNVDHLEFGFKLIDGTPGVPYTLSYKIIDPDGIVIKTQDSCWSNKIVGWYLGVRWTMGFHFAKRGIHKMVITYDEKEIDTYKFLVI